MTQRVSIGSVKLDDLSGWWEAYLRHRYGFLFYSLLLSLGGTPISRALGFSGIGFELFWGLNLLAAIPSIDKKIVRRVPLVIVALAILVRFISLWVGHATLSTLSLVALTLIALYAVFGLLRYVLRSSAISIEHLYAGLSAYLLVGVFLGVLYWALEEAWPASIIMNSQTPQPFSLIEGIYFSFITLATVGYGDFVPGSDVVRGLAVVEAMAGEVCLVVGNGGVVGVFIWA